MRFTLLLALAMLSGFRQPHNINTWWLYKNNALVVANEQKGTGKLVSVSLIETVSKDSWEMRYHICGGMGTMRNDSMVLLTPEGRRITAGSQTGSDHRIRFVLKKEWFLGANAALQDLQCTWNGSIAICTFRPE